MKRVLAVSEYNDPRNTRHRLHLVDADDPFRLSLLSVLETPDIVHSLRNRDGLLYCSMPKGFSIYDVSSLEAVKELSHLDLYGGIRCRAGTVQLRGSSRRQDTFWALRSRRTLSSRQLSVLRDLRLYGRQTQRGLHCLRYSRSIKPSAEGNDQHRSLEKPWNGCSRRSCLCLGF